MKKTKVIARTNLPTRPPLLFSMVVYLMLEHFNAAGWVYGIVGTIAVIFWICFFVNLFDQDSVDIFKKSE